MNSLLWAKRVVKVSDYLQVWDVLVIASIAHISTKTTCSGRQEHIIQQCSKNAENAEQNEHEAKA